MQYRELDNDSNTPQNPMETQWGANSHSLIEIWEQLCRHWVWFVLGLFIAWSCATIYLRYAENLYSAEAKVLLKEDLSFQTSELSALMGRGLGKGDTKPNISDQIEVMRSRRLIGKVVDNLQLNIRYFSDARLKRQEFLGDKAPVKVSVLSKDVSYLNFEVFIKSKSEIEITHNEKIIKSAFGKTIKLNDVELMVLPKGSSVGKTLHVVIYPVSSEISMLKRKLSIIPINDGSVLSVSMVDNLPDRARIVVDELIKQYNEDALNDKQRIGEKTTQFIEERLAKVSDDLQAKDQDVEVFKKGNNVINLEAEGGISLTEASANNAQVLEQSTQLSLVNSMQDYLRNNQNDLIPENIGLTDGAVNANASKYNQLILARMDMLKHSTESSQIVQNLNQQIQEIRTNLNQSLTNYKKTTQISLGSIQGESGRIASKINRFPTQEKEFKNISRQQQIVEALYLFLLQKREENEITNAATPSSIKVVDYAYSSNIAISPNQNNIYLMATAAGLLVPFAVLYLMFLMNNKVQSRRDLDKLGISIIGDIPSTKSDMIIQENDRSVLAESFRMLRTNIGFYLSGKNNLAKTVFITSTVSGEGKTFIAVNLATILSASKKHKVLLIGADIRNPRILEMLDITQFNKRKGITQFLSDHDLPVEDIIISETSLPFDIIHSGALAPNPSELLMNGRFKEMLNQVKGRYDYIVVDTAPTSLVTDTQIIADFADLFLYVIRANYLDKRMLEMPEDLYRDKRLPNMALILNDVGAGKGYGYGYGYSYGYGYGYASKNPKGWKRFLPKNLLKK